MNLWATWMRSAKKLGRVRVIFEASSGQEYTAEELTLRATALAPQLAGFRPGQRIAFQLPNGVEWLALFLALQRQGLAAMPLDGGLRLEGSLDLARRLKARALFTNDTWHDLNHRAPARRAIACIKVTSGTSEGPKAVGCTAGHLLADGRNIIATMGIRPRDRNLAAIPLGHSYGLGNLVMPLILQGTGLVCATSFLPRQLLDWMERYRVTVLPSVPAIFRVLSTLPPGQTPPALRTAISAGAMLSPEIAQAFHARFGVKIHNFYGSSETGGIAYDRTGRASWTGRSVGKPLAGVRVTIRTGRVEVRSKAVATASGREFMPDWGEWNEQDELVLLGRMGHGANIGGKKVHPLEVERTLRSLTGVSDACVWLDHRDGRDVLAAAVETNLTRAEVEHGLASKLPSWKLPKFYLLAVELPRTPRGKLATAQLQATKWGS